jgi:sigma-B regulation protein RsbU (phosphoserine phosphatase)
MQWIDSDAATLLRGQVVDVAAGAVFLFVGLATCSIAALRLRSGVRVFLWLGIWSAMYGAGRLSQSPAVATASPGWLQYCAPYATEAVSYLLVVAGSLSFLELSLGRLRVLMRVATSVGLTIAVLGILAFVFTGSHDGLMLYNNLLATGVLIVLIGVVAVPRLAARYLALPYRGVLAFGTLAFALEALWANLARPFGFDSPRLLGHLGFAALLFAFGYVAAQQVVSNERRLLAVDKELGIARDIQLAILPSGPPQIQCLRMSVAYRPMTAVAGDFYHFVAVDEKRVGILVADVAGHGVPAALIASMIKVAVQSVVFCAHDPGAVLHELNRILCGDLRGRLASAAYLWVDTESRTVRYAAAGHPPLLRWGQGELQQIESNGLLFGIARECDYPVFTATLNAGDRFILYTDGVVETDDGHGEFFGDRRLEEVVRHNQHKTPSALSDTLLAEVDHWRPASVPQQDDITLIVIDVTPAVAS